MILSFDQRPDATVDEKVRSLMESVQRAFNSIDGGTITGTISGNNVKLIKVDGSSLVGEIDGNYVFVKNLDARSVTAEEGWVDKLMVQTGLLAHEGTVFELDAIQVNAANITAGTIDVERLVVTDATTGKKHMVTWNETTQQWDAAYLDGNAIADNTIAAGKIVANSITTREITVENLVGTSGWINLKNGTFSYTNATTNKGITWDGSALNIKADSILLGAASEDLTATLSLKANKATLTSEINATADTVKINANKLNITGVITAINDEGTTTIDGGRITANSITANEIDASAIKVRKIEDGQTNYAEITSSGLNIVKNSTSVASFGDSVRVGTQSETYIEITPTGTAAGIKFKTKGSNSATGLILADFGMDTSTGYTTEGWPEAAWFTLGYRTGTKGYYSTVAGYGCVSSHNASFAGGIDTTAYGPMSFAYGNHCITGYSGNSSTNPGTTGNNGWASVALGSNCIAQRDAQIVVGAYNAITSDLFIVGNGSANGRKNAFVIDWAGNATVVGAVNALDVKASNAVIADTFISTVDLYVTGSVSGIAYDDVGAAAASHTHSTQGSINATVASNGNSIYFKNQDGDYRAATVQYARNQSDIRLKDHIVKMGSMRDTVIDFYNRLEPIQFTYKRGVRDDVDKIRNIYGFSAQDIERAASESGLHGCEMVYETEAEEGTGMYKLTGKMHKNLDYDSFHALHVLYAQHLEERIRRLEEKLS
jgi:hypothetical protein